MSLLGMIKGASIALGAAGSLFKNPAAAEMDSLGPIKQALNNLSDSVHEQEVLLPATYPVPWSGLPVVDKITGASTGILDEITKKLSNIGHELMLTVSAAKTAASAAATDAVVSGNLSAIPNQISQAFPSAGAISPAFGSLTGAKAIVGSGRDAIAACFDLPAVGSTHYAAMHALYLSVNTSLNKINNVTNSDVKNGMELLTAIGSNQNADMQAPLVLMPVVPGYSAAIKDAFARVEAAADSMKNEHAATVVTADNAVKDAISTVTGSSFVSMLTSKVPEIANVMKAVVDTSAIDHKAITISEAIKAGSIKLPGAESIAAVTSGAPTPAMPEASVSVKQMIEPAPGKPECVNYTKAELDGFQTTVDNAMAASAAYNAEFAQWSKTNIEDWKISVDYNAKKKAAGATADNLHGTSTDPAVMAAWDQVYFQPGGYVGRRDEFNLTRLPESRRLAALANAMKAEKTKRYMFGKFPYTFAESLGKIYPEAEQTTLLDSTK